MADLIRRQAAIEHLKKRLIETAINNVGVRALCDSIFADIADNRIETWIAELPSAQPEQKPGKWIKDCNVAFYWKCSECGAYLIGSKEDYLLRENDYPNYCPNCGAKMDEKEGEM